MSRGHGHVQRAIINAFAENPTAVLTVPHLVAIAFPGLEPAPKHQVAVLRAARRLAEDRPDFETYPGRPGHGGRILVNAANTRSLAIGRVYQHFDGDKTLSECIEFLEDPKSEAYVEARPDGFLDLIARRNQLWAGWRDDEAEILSIEIRRRVAQAEQARA